MLREKEIEITIDTDGTVTSEQIGWDGKSCHGAIDDLIKALGKKAKTNRTRDFFKEEKVRINQRTN